VPDPHRRRGLIIDFAFAWMALGFLWTMGHFNGYETVPYHLLFVTFTAVYGYRTWSLPKTLMVLGAMVSSTGAIMIYRWRNGDMPFDELFEIVLMPTILAGMIWHSRRRVALTNQLERLHLQERTRRMREHEFARDTTHAFRTPLTIARAHVELMSEDGDDQTRQDAEVVLTEIDRMARMASQLLAITELERPQALALRDVDIAALVSQAHARWSVSVRRDWALSAPPSLVARVDEDVVRVCLDALVENALHVTGERDNITLICGERHGQVFIAVGDSGPGIDPAVGIRVFERFYRDPDRIEGTGLGLAYVRAAADAHGGDVRVARFSRGGALVAFEVGPRASKLAPGSDEAVAGAAVG
jgi:two-component system, OmpR family, sensor kinase